MEMLKQLAPILMVAGVGLLALGMYYLVGSVGFATFQAKACFIAGGICLGVAAFLSDIEQAEKERERRQAAQAPQTAQPPSYANSNTGGPITQNPDSGQRNTNDAQQLPPGTYVIGGQTVIVLSSSANSSRGGLNVESGASTAAVAR